MAAADIAAVEAEDNNADADLTENEATEEEELENQENESGTDDGEGEEVSIDVSEKDMDDLLVILKGHIKRHLTRPVPNRQLEVDLVELDGDKAETNGELPYKCYNEVCVPKFGLHNFDTLKDPSLMIRTWPCWYLNFLS